MGMYLNPGSQGFAGICDERYVDKTGLIGLVNRAINGSERLICVSRPRRFGKSYAAQMLCAYYDRTCDSHDLFDRYEIASEASYEKYMNKFDVVYVDMTGVMGEANPTEYVSYLKRNILSEIKDAYPEVKLAEGFAASLVNTVSASGCKIIMIIDEWDAPIREAGSRWDIQKEYLEFLRSLFKNSGTTNRIFAAVYMTGILPIKKDGSGSAISDFMEYPILFPGEFSQYAGFTEGEVKELCGRYGMDFQEAKSWYDGYDFQESGPIYNPYSVMRAMKAGKFRSYWKNTSAAESLMAYINMDEDGLQETLARMISGEEAEVDIDSFENDLNTFASRDDVLTLLIHLGYLTYRENTKTARIPNEEVRMEFRKILGSKKVNQKWMELIRASRQLLQDTISGNEEAVGQAIERIRETAYAPAFYNDEQSLRYVIKFAYIVCVDQYAQVEEMPSGRGIADVVYIPKRRSALPALLIELRWNRSGGGAIAQIKDRNYPAVLRNYGGDIILAGISYSERTKTHSCKIERIKA